MADVFSGCYECSRSCVDTQFCLEGANISLPTNLRIKIIANPTFWGFDDGSGNVLIQGNASYSNGYFDFFDGFDETHFAYKTCDATTTGPYKNEQRPDVAYRSVYDPETGTKHYGVDGTLDNIERGGPEVYLVDRGGEDTDLASCDTSDPLKVFKKAPEYFGFGNKINFTDKVFRNSTGAWRYIDYSGCYPSDYIYTDSGVCPECDGTPKQDLLSGAEYDIFQTRVSGEPACMPDGHVPQRYQGTFRATDSLLRNTGVSEFIVANLVYGTGAAVSLRDGMMVGLHNEVDNSKDGSFIIFDVNHYSNYSEVKLAATAGTGVFNLEIGPSGYWTAFNSLDPRSCCGGYAYGVDNNLKWYTNIRNYHNDFGRIFNNEKNIIQSNRFPENRQTYNQGTISPLVESGARLDHSYPSLTSSGTIELDASGYPVFEKRKPYYGPFYIVDKFDNTVRRNRNPNRGYGNNGTCYSKNASMSVFPDCATQYIEYDECETLTTRYVTNQVPRLAITYRGCDFYGNCEFDSQGRPLAGWSGSTPQSVSDLRRGLAGLEIYMYVNLGDAIGTVLEKAPCACDGDIPPGTDPPVYTTIPSPVTFKSFPKFDLYPSSYGCSDKGWQSQHYDCEGAVWSGDCTDFPEMTHACDVRQPYTTYGFIRSLCGAQNDDRKSVITSAFSSLIQAGTYRNTTPNSGNNEPMYWEFTNPYIHESGLTSGMGTSGNFPFWGVTDTNGRLVLPHFNTKVETYEFKCGGTQDYLNYDRCATWNNGWPKDHTPFLIEIDHSDDCLTCVTPLMDASSNLILTLEGLDTSFLHAPNNSTKYGFSHCKYKGIANDPTFTCASGFSKVCPSGLDNDGVDTSQYNHPYTGNTCPVMSGDFSLGPIKIEDTNIAIGWRSNAGGINSLVRISGSDNIGTDVSRFFDPGFEVYGSFRLACFGNHDYLLEHRVSDFNIPFASLGNPDYTGVINTVLDNIYNGGSCAHHVPSADTDLKLDARFMLIGSGLYDDYVQYVPEKYLSSIGADTPEDWFGVDLGLFADDRTRLWQLVQNLVSSNAMGCPSYLIVYGCYVDSTSGFYPCHDCNGVSPTLPCNCPDIDCNGCGRILSADGHAGDRLPPSFVMDCGCDCNLQIMKIIEVNGRGNVSTIYNADSGSCVFSNDFITCNGTDPCGFAAAIQASGANGVTPITYNDYNSQYGSRIRYAFLDMAETTSSSACSWHSGPNMNVSGITHELKIPRHLVNGSEFCSTLDPPTCDPTDCAQDSLNGASTCLDLIPWTGDIPDNGVTLTRRSCYPEVMIVNKIDCLESGKFRLYVDREFHSHDRTWEIVEPLGDPPVNSCVTKQYGAYLFNDGEVCEPIPYATPSDSVTPAYEGSCSNHPSSGTFVNQDFRFTNSAGTGDYLWNYYNLFYSSGFPNSSVWGIHPSGSYEYAIQLDDNFNPVCPSPCPTGAPGYSDWLYTSSWGLINNLCNSGFAPVTPTIPGMPLQTTSTFCAATGCGDTTTISGEYIPLLFSTGEFINPTGLFGTWATNRQHSCIQDSIECGGEFFCNKMFFPRRSYKAGTRISRFGALSVCTQTSEFENPPWYFGYQSHEDRDIENQIYLEAENSNFVDVCNTGNITYLSQDTGIDDVTIIVDDYLPLMGIPANLFRYTSDIKSCIIIDSGCPSSWLPTHSDSSIAAGIHAPMTFLVNNKTSMGYYLDKLISSGSDYCLFTPFKIYVDVECCSSNIRRKDRIHDEPTSLEYIVEGVPSWACNGLVDQASCGCEETTCGQQPQNSGDGMPNYLRPYVQTHKEPICLSMCLAYEVDYIPFPPPQGTRNFLPFGYICTEGNSPPYDDSTPIYDGQIVSCPGFAGGGGGGCTPKCFDIWGYQCGDVIYVPSGRWDPVSPTESGCCPNFEDSVCNTLVSALVISGDGCFDTRTLTGGNFSANWRDCGCESTKRYDTCEDSVIKIIITEE